MKKKVLVAAAWPYVNGSLHLGHVAALLPADVLARYHRANGDDVLFVSGSDCHGTPILVTADKEGRAPEEVAGQYHDEIVETLVKKLGFSYSLYSKTMGAFHKGVAQEVFAKLHADGHMVTREEQQARCDTCNRTLPDRFIEGKCPNPKCGVEGARGDQCDTCGHLHTPHDLIAPHCRTCGATPVWKPSTHLYLHLPAFQKHLAEWKEKSKEGWRENAVKITEAWLTKGLEDRPITRDLSWGIPVPVEGFTEKVMYVWFEAVIGYLSCSREWASLQTEGLPEAWREWWDNPEAVHYYVHGKDNIPFHTIIWPAMLMALGLHLPNRIISSEFLNFGGVKLSKSKNIGIWLPNALAKFDPDAIRFYLTLNSPESKDSTFRWDDFEARVNADLVGNLGNFWNRTFSMTHRYFGAVPNSGVPVSDESVVLWMASPTALREVGAFIEKGELRQALVSILNFSRKANVYIEHRAPWRNIESNKAHVAETLKVCMEVADALRRLTAPFFPGVTERLNAYLGTDDVSWRYSPLAANTPIGQPTPLIPKVDHELILGEIQLAEAGE
ncbi:MAG: methionine--tRNA ligase [Patescibacteria group bacterium]|nr:methionine--tRNA ligase [Patescibacteria group bacterium]